MLFRRSPQRHGVVLDDGEQFFSADCTAGLIDALGRGARLVSRGLAPREAADMAAELQVRRCIGAVA